MLIRPHTTDHSNRKKAGVTLVELLVAMGLSLMLSVVVLTFYVFFAKATLVASDYSEFDRNTGTFLQYFARDVKEAEDVIWISAAEFRLLKKGVYIAYNYDSELKTVTRTSPGETANKVASNVTNLQFAAYDITGTPIPVQQSLSEANLKTKMMQVIGSSSSHTNAGTQTSAPLTSARYILRNKAIPLP